MGAVTFMDVERVLTGIELEAPPAGETAQLAVPDMGGARWLRSRLSSCAIALVYLGADAGCAARADELGSDTGSVLLSPPGVSAIPDWRRVVEDSTCSVVCACRPLTAGRCSGSSSSASSANEGGCAGATGEPEAAVTIAGGPERLGPLSPPSFAASAVLEAGRDPASGTRGSDAGAPNLAARLRRGVKLLSPRSAEENSNGSD